MTRRSWSRNTRARCRSDQAQVDNAKLEPRPIAASSRRSPGRVGLRQVDPGNYVQTSDANGIVVITQMQPISVIFSVPEDNLPPIMKRLRRRRDSCRCRPTTAPTRRCWRTARSTSVDNQIDTTTGTVKLRATFANEDELLFPNQFVNARLLVDTLHRTSCACRSRPCSNGAPGTFVYVVNADNTVSVRPVKVGPIDGERTERACQACRWASAW